MSDTIVENNSTTTPPSDIQVVGIIGGSSLFHAKNFTEYLSETTVSTKFGDVLCYIGIWQGSTNLKIVFIQRHHANTDRTYKIPRQVNFQAITCALQVCGCDYVIGVYSMGSMTPVIPVGRFVVPEDYFNPFAIMHMSGQYDAHVVPHINNAIRTEILAIMEKGGFEVHNGGVYIQSAGPRFETKAEVRFFAQFGELIGMTGANEAELLNELRIPFGMFGIIDNLAHGIGADLSLEAFKDAQKNNTIAMEKALCYLIDSLASKPDLIAKFTASNLNQMQAEPEILTIPKEEVTALSPEVQ